MKRILITGAAGFIGSNLVKSLIEADVAVVTGVDNMSNGYSEFLPDGFTFTKFITADFSHPRILSKIQNQKFDVVIHLAAIPRVSYSVEHPLKTHDTNVTKTMALLDACRGNVERFIFASSSSVYGGADVLPTSESHPRNPKSPYALQKAIIEDYLKMYNELYGLDSAAMRFFNVFGPNALGISPYSTALAAWLTAIKSGKSMRSDGDGSQSRDLCHVDNVVEALTKATFCSTKLSAETFNVACGDRTTNEELLQYLFARYPGSTANRAPWRAGDVAHTQADISKIKKVLGYSPVTRVWEGVEATCKWYDENWHWAQKLTPRDGV